MYPIKKLGQLLTHRKEFVTINDLEDYKLCRVQWYGNGVTLRKNVKGTDVKTKQQQVCRTGEFLVAEIDAKDGGFGVVPNELDGAIVSSHYFLFQIDTTALNPNYLRYFVRTKHFQDQVSARGTTNYSAIRPNHVLEYTIPLPPMDEQQRIVLHIDAIAERIAAARRLQRDAMEAAEATITATVKFLIDEGVKEKWQSLSVDSACETIIDYRGKTPNVGSEGDIPYVTSACIRAGKIDWSKVNRFFSRNDYEIHMTRGFPKVDDVIFTMEAPLGETGLIEDDRVFGLAQRLILIRGRRDLVRSDYLARVLMSSSVQAQILANSTGTTVKGIASKRLIHIKLPIPPVDEQRDIVAYLDAVQEDVKRLMHLQAETAVELDALLPSLLDQAFRGEL